MEKAYYGITYIAMLAVLGIAVALIGQGIIKMELSLICFGGLVIGQKQHITFTKLKEQTCGWGESDDDTLCNLDLLLHQEREEVRSCPCWTSCVRTLVSKC